MVNIAKTPTAKKGTNLGVKSLIDNFDILQATNKFEPTGGVICPMAKLTVANTPNAYIGYPIDFTTGIRIGNNK